MNAITSITGTINGDRSEGGAHRAIGACVNRDAQLVRFADLRVVRGAGTKIFSPGFEIDLNR